MGEIEVKCPNAACSAVFAVDASTLGAKARCYECGTEFVATASARPVAAERATLVDSQADDQLLLGQYEIQQLLGRGGMGEVCLVRSRSTQERFAVKQVLSQHLGSEKQRRAFLGELRTWINLPEHPNLTACRFFRTVEDRIMVFAEYVEGGSLSSWIHGGDGPVPPLYQGGPQKALERILDTAIQFAWGLQAAHDEGLVHQDVKPANVLMTPDGVAKVTDFGLARVLAAASEGDAAEGVEYSGAMTPEYCSPEQAQRTSLTHKTDMWSWGLSVLEMFAGRAFWAKRGVKTGHLAGQVLRRFGQTGAADTAVPAMPPPAADVLARCFHDEPTQRWASMLDAADALVGVYQDVLGQRYPRTPPAVAAAVAEGIPHDRRTTAARPAGRPGKTRVSGCGRR